MSNQSIATEFLLLEFPESQELQIVYFAVLFLIYAAALIGNVLVVLVVASNQCLHTPMFFFRVNLSLADLGYISVTIPKAMTNSLLAIRHISFPECMTQVFFFSFFVTLEFLLLTVMAYDRYIAVCRPLHHDQLLGKVPCIQIVAAVWLISLCNALWHTSCTSKITFCSNVLDQFYCEPPQLLKLSCHHSYFPEYKAIVFSTLLWIGCFGFIVISYFRIFRAVFRIPSVQGRRKTISTCLPHLIVLCLSCFTGYIAYLGPSSRFSPLMGLALAVTYSVIPPLMNPIIYSIKNKELRTALKTLACTNKCYTYT